MNKPINPRIQSALVFAFAISVVAYALFLMGAP